MTSEQPLKLYEQPLELSDLPREMLATVARHLPREDQLALSSTCRDFRDFLLGNTVRKYRFDCRDREKFRTVMTDDSSVAASASSSQPNHVPPSDVLPHIQGLTTNVVEGWITSCISLRTLSIRLLNNADGQMVDLSNLNFPKEISGLTLCDSYRSSSFEISGNLSELPGLRKLGLTYLDRPVVEKISEKWGSTVQRLSIHDLLSREDTAITPISLSNFTDLTEIHISGQPHHQFNRYNINGRIDIDTLPHRERLEIVNITRDTVVSHRVLRNLSQFGNLSVLNVVLGGNSIQYLPTIRQLARLKALSLDLTSIPAESPVDMSWLRDIRTLTHLRVDASPDSAVSLTGHIRHMTKLEVLRLNDIHGNLDDEFQSLRRLRFLILTPTAPPSNERYREMLAPPTRLRSLTLRVAQFSSLCLSLPRLRNLSLHLHGNPHWDSLEDSLKNCTRLRSVTLDVERVQPKVSPEVIKEMAANSILSNCSLPPSLTSMRLEQRRWRRVELIDT